jgi:glutaconate CoA-transferase subunit A
VVATVEKRVPRLPRVTIPSFQVDLIAELPGGARPTGCAGLYPHDEATLLAYLDLAEAGRGHEWLEAAVATSASERAA